MDRFEFTKNPGNADGQKAFGEARRAGSFLRESGNALMRTPKGSRLCIGLFGRRNVGKSSVLNAVADQRVSIVSDFAGTTTDPVDKPMELLPLGPVLFIDTAGVDDEGAVGMLRVEQTMNAVARCDIGVLVTEAGVWGPFEDAMLARLREEKVPVVIVFNKVDLLEASSRSIAWEALEGFCRGGIPEEARGLPCVCMAAERREGVGELAQALIDCAPEDYVNAPAIISDVVPAGSTAVLVIPLDKEAPRGRLILPQVQVIRDLLDGGCMPLCVRDCELPAALRSLREPPALVVTDSQVFDAVAEMVPEDVPLTGFSVAFARNKGDLMTQALGTLSIDRLTPDSKVLIAEACTHHPIGDDIGRVKIPRLLRKRVGEGLAIDNVRGADFPENLSEYDLVIHCGGCMFTRRQMLSRIRACVDAGVPVSNYGLTLAYCMGVFERSIKAFPGVSEQVLEV